MVILETVAGYTSSNQITAEQWDQIRLTLVWLWVFVGSIIIFAGNVLIGHGIIPSLASSRDLPLRFMSYRPILFAAAAVFLLCAIFAFVNFVIELQVLYEIYPRVWI